MQSNCTSPQTQGWFCLTLRRDKKIYYLFNLAYFKMDIKDEIKKIEEEIRNTPYNKATQHHIGKLKAKLARLRDELDKRERRGGGGRGYAVRKEGDATVAIVGLPSVGKSTLLNRLTRASSEVADYPFTTLDVIPGIMEYRGARIQILDVPGIIEGASTGRGRGKEVLSVVRNADLILIVTDVFNLESVELIEKELRNAGIRLNERPPDVVIKKLATGGIRISRTGEVSISDETVKNILREFRVHNADVIIRENITIDQLVDVLVGNRRYIPSIVVINKIDLGEDLLNGKLIRKGWIAVSAEKGINLEELKNEIFQKLNLIRVYLKPRDGKTDFSEPLVIRKGSTVRDVCERIHRDFVSSFRYAKIWGKSVKFPGQRVGLDHKLEDGDMVSVYVR